MTPKAATATAKPPADILGEAKSILADRESFAHSSNAEWESGCWRTLTGIMQRQLRGRSKASDAEKLANVLADMRAGGIDFEPDRIPRCMEVIQESERLHAAHADQAAALEALAKAGEERTATKERHRREETEARHRWGAAQTRLREARNAHVKLQELAKRFAPLFDTSGELPKVIPALD